MGNETKHTPGPWAWFGNTDTGEVTLATTHSGRIFVLRLGRDGSTRKRPCIMVQDKKVMKPLTDFVKYEVCPDAGANRADPRVYRADFHYVSHPDLLLIAAAPELLEALEDIVAHGLAINGPTCPSCGRDNSHYGNICTSDECMGVAARAAIAKATGAARD